MTDRPSTSTADRPVDGSDGSMSTAVHPSTPTDREPWTLRYGLPSALWIESTVASLMASKGQLGFAAWAGVHGPAAYGVPVILDLFSVILLLLGYRQGRRKRSPYLLWALGSGMAAVSTYTNVVHSGPRAWVIYGGASAVTLLAWLVKLWIDLGHYLERVGHKRAGRPKMGLLPLVAPRVAFHFWTVTVRRPIKTHEAAIAAAETWIHVRDDTYRALRTAKNHGWWTARRLAVRTAWRTVYDMTGGPVTTTPRTVEIQTVRPSARADVPPSSEATAQASAESTVKASTRPNGSANRPSTRRQTKPSGGVHMVWSPTIRNNAAELRRRYPDGLPSSVRQIRTAMGWSNDKATPAVAAYEAKADLEDLEDAA